MNAIEHLQSVRWQHPEHYAGFSPDGDYLIASQHRESDTVTRSNFQCILHDLLKTCDGLPDVPEDRLPAGFMQSKGGLSPRSEGWAYVFRASHPMAGWCEYLLVRQDAPESLLQQAGEILSGLADYPVYSDDDLGELEFNEAAEYWSSCSVSERLDILRGARADHISMFACRRSEIPAYDCGSIVEWIKWN